MIQIPRKTNLSHIGNNDTQNKIFFLSSKVSINSIIYDTNQAIVKYNDEFNVFTLFFHHIQIRSVSPTQRPLEQLSKIDKKLFKLIKMNGSNNVCKLIPTSNKYEFLITRVNLQNCYLEPGNVFSINFKTHYINKLQLKKQDVASDFLFNNDNTGEIFILLQYRMTCFCEILCYSIKSNTYTSVASIPYHLCDNIWPIYNWEKGLLYLLTKNKKIVIFDTNNKKLQILDETEQYNWLTQTVEAENLIYFYYWNDNFLKVSRHEKIELGNLSSGETKTIIDTPLTKYCVQIQQYVLMQIEVNNKQQLLIYDLSTLKYDVIDSQIQPSSNLVIDDQKIKIQGLKEEIFCISYDDLIAQGNVKQRKY